MVSCYRNYRPHRGVALTRQARRNKRQWSRTVRRCQRRHWSSVLFSEESRFNAFHHCSRMRVYRRGDASKMFHGVKGRHALSSTHSVTLISFCRILAGQHHAHGCSNNPGLSTRTRVAMTVTLTDRTSLGSSWTTDKTTSEPAEQRTAAETCI